MHYFAIKSDYGAELSDQRSNALSEKAATTPLSERCIISRKRYIPC